MLIERPGGMLSRQRKHADAPRRHATKSSPIERRLGGSLALPGSRRFSQTLLVDKLVGLPSSANRF
jgi:hypothetical protein